LRGKAEAKESLFFFSLGEEGDSTYGLFAATSEAKESVAFLCVVLRTRNCQKQTLSNPTARSRGANALLHRKFKFEFSRCESRRLKFTNLASNLNVKSQGEVSRDDFKCFEVNFIPRLDM